MLPPSLFADKSQVYMLQPQIENTMHIIRLFTGILSKTSEKFYSYESFHNTSIRPSIFSPSTSHFLFIFLISTVLIIVSEPLQLLCYL